jgi:Lrp/AsnC family transcriptional regulator, leucine-responsive regulatory protein
MKLDTFDCRLLNVVQEDSDRTAQQIAQSVPLSVSAVQRRLRRLREIGVIQRHCAVVDPRMIGQPEFFVVGLQVESESPELLTALRDWLIQEPQVQQAFYVTGESDFVLIVTAPNTANYDALMARMIDENPNVRRFTTNVAMNLVKRGLTIPIDEETSDGHAV